MTYNLHRGAELDLLAVKTQQLTIITAKAGLSSQAGFSMNSTESSVYS